VSRELFAHVTFAELRFVLVGFTCRLSFDALQLKPTKSGVWLRPFVPQPNLTRSYKSDLSLAPLILWSTGAEKQQLLLELRLVSWRFVFGHFPVIDRF